VFIFSGGNDFAEYDNGAAVASPSREFIYSTGISGSGLLASISAGTITYFHSDHLDLAREHGCEFRLLDALWSIASLIGSLLLGYVVSPLK
jgi:hypothetical protein